MSHWACHFAVVEKETSTTRAASTCHQVGRCNAVLPHLLRQEKWSGETIVAHTGPTDRMQHQNIEYEMKCAHRHVFHCGWYFSGAIKSTIFARSFTHLNDSLPLFDYAAATQYTCSTCVKCMVYEFAFGRWSTPFSRLTSSPSEKG